MALQQQFEDAFGVTHTEGYHRVTGIFLEVDAQRGAFHLSSYHNQATRRAGRDPVATTAYRLDGARYTAVFGAAALSPAGSNPSRAVYLHLKSLTEWENATDV